MSRFIDITGLQFGRLKVITRGENAKLGHAQWVCECSCDGKHILVKGRYLRSGVSQSCGCLQKELTSQRSTTHGMRYTVEYQSYIAAKARCENPNNKNYKDYGGRGIKFRYRNFEEFITDLGVCPPWKILDRVDCNGHYEVGNCHWVTYVESNNNRRDNVLVTAFGQTATLTQWSRKTGIHRDTIRKRVQAGWSSEHLFDQPTHGGRAKARAQ